VDDSVVPGVRREIADQRSGQLQPLDVDYPIERDKGLRRYRIEPVAAELLLGAVSALARLDWLPGRGSAGA
jgi:hypothetical protein